MAHLCQSAARLCVRQELERIEQEQERQHRAGQESLPEHNAVATIAASAIHDPTIPTPTPRLVITQTHFEQALREWLVEYSFQTRPCTAQSALCRAK